MTRVLVCSDRIGAAGPAEAGRALAVAFAEEAAGRAQLAVVPCAAGGADLAASLDALGAAGPWVGGADARALGRALAAALAPRPERLYVDLTELPDAWGAAELILAGAGGVPAAARDAAGGTELIAVLPPDQGDLPLLGLEGVAARLGYAAGEPAATVLERDAHLAGLAEALGVADAPGLGAAGGAPLAVAALGGRPATGFGLCRAAARLDDTLARADLVVAGTDSFTIGDFGGPVVLGLAPLATAAAVPLLAVARTADISPRELRRHGVEAVHALGGGAAPAASAITERARAVARTWLRGA